MDSKRSLPKHQQPKPRAEENHAAKHPDVTLNCSLYHLCDYDYGLVEGRKSYVEAAGIESLLGKRRRDGRRMPCVDISHVGAFLLPSATKRTHKQAVDEVLHLSRKHELMDIRATAPYSSDVARIDEKLNAIHADVRNNTPESKKLPEVIRHKPFKVYFTTNGKAVDLCVPNDVVWEFIKQSDAHETNIHEVRKTYNRQKNYVDSYEISNKSTFGRFFTNAVILQKIAQLLKTRFLRPDDTYVDMSAGENSFGAMLGLSSYIGFDIYPARKNACRVHFRQINWFEVKHLPPDCVIGLNPPFGPRGRTAKQFCLHALKFLPRLLVLIVPGYGFDLQNRNYECVYTDDTICGGSAFYIPGSIGKTASEHMVVQPSDRPVLFVYQRKDDIH